ncbi:hypothetical protein ACOMHN_055265 [Nucella lapillus]
MSQNTQPRAALLTQITLGGKLQINTCGKSQIDPDSMSQDVQILTGLVSNSLTMSDGLPRTSSKDSSQTNQDTTSGDIPSNHVG